MCNGIVLSVRLALWYRAGCCRNEWRKSMNRLMLSIRVWLVRSVNEYLTEGLPTIGRACRHTATRAATCTRTNALHRLYPQCQRQELDCVGGAIPRLQRRQLLRRQRQGDGELRPVPSAAHTCDDRPCTSTEPSCVFWARNTAPSTGTEPQLSTRQRTCGVAAETHSTTHARGRRDVHSRGGSASAGPASSPACTLGSRTHSEGQHADLSRDQGP